MAQEAEGGVSGSPPERVRVVVSGRVQGVWYRGWTVDEARARGLDSGVGVTIYITGSAEFILNSDSHAELSAQTTGPLAGVVIFQDPNVADGTVHLFNSDTTSYLVGTVYLPNGKVMINSGSTLGGPAAFTSFVAKTFEINSDSTLVLNTDYGATDVPALPALGAFQVALIE